MFFFSQTELLEECNGKEITLLSHGKDTSRVLKMFMLMVKMYPFISDVHV